MQAIRTTYHAPTATKGPRITAVNAWGDKCTVPVFNVSNMGENDHLRATEALCDKLHWKGRLIAGELRDGMVFVFDPESSPSVPNNLTRPTT